MLSTLPRSATTAQILVELGRDHGVAVKQCLDGTGLDPARLAELDAEIEPDEELAIIRNLLRALPTVPTLGILAGRRYHVTAYGSIGFALFSSPTLYDAFDIGVRYFELAFPFYQVSLERRDDEVHLVLDDREVPEDVRRFIIQRDLSSLATIGADLGLPALLPSRLELRFPEPAYAAVLLELGQGRVQVSWNAPINRIVIDRRELDRALPQGNERMLKMCEAECQAQLQKRQQKRGVAGRVRSLLAATVGEIPSMEKVAKGLGTTPWTLRRQLVGEGTSFRSLVEEVRERLAVELLADTSLAIEDVSTRLGYSEPAAFTHAFSRWKGVAPQAFRARQKG